MKSNKVFLSYVRENQPIVQYIDQILTDYGMEIITDYRYILHSALVLTHFGIFTTNPRHERIRTG